MKMIPKVLLGASGILLTLGVACSIGHGVADTWRGTIDDVLGTQSYITDTSNPKYVSTYKTPEELMEAAKALAIREGAEGTVVMKNDNNALPMAKNAKVALFGGASYKTYMSAAKNADQVTLEKALTDAGMTIDTTVKGIYDAALAAVKVVSGKNTYPWQPNTKAGDYVDFQIKEINPTKMVSEGFAASTWKDAVDADIGIVTISRPGGEGSTYKPGSALDNDGNATNKNPLALSDDELAVIQAAKDTCGKVVVLLNTSCTIEVAPLAKGGTHEVDAICYIGIPNDYQLAGTVQVLDGDVNPSGALADTYATSSTNSPAMMNFGGGYYKDFTEVSNFTDDRWPGTPISNKIGGSFGGAATYSGGFYVPETEGIYTGYNYYETRYYDSIANPSYNATAGTANDTVSGGWHYNNEVNYTFGHGLSYLEYEQSLESVDVDVKADGEIKAKVKVTNKGAKDGKFLAQLYVSSPYTQYDIDNFVEKSAVQFLTSEKVDVAANSSETIELTIPTKYMASYDYTKAKTYILDAGDYYFSVGAGAHKAVNNVLTAQGKTPDEAGSTTAVKKWSKGGDTDVTTFAVSSNGKKVTNIADDVDINYWLPDSQKVTYLSRHDWQGTYPEDLCMVTKISGDPDGDLNGKYYGKFAIGDSPKKDEWLKDLRNQQYTPVTTDTVSNTAGVAGPKFDAESIGYEQMTNIEDPYWDKLVEAIPAGEALGAVAHGGSQSDKLTNIDNPIVKQNDGPNGFNGKALSTNNGASAEEDPYYADPTSEAGKFKACINSQTLLGSSFSPKLARDWGRLLGNTGLWVSNYQIWGAGLNYHRTPYNGRNTEYLSEDPMLSNIIGREQTIGTLEFGIISGPKHIGFNDQEYDRSGVSVYMNEQKFRQTDLRGFEGAVTEGKALGLMIAFNRVGATNASHHVGMVEGLFRNEWGFKGLISTDMMNNKYYFNPEGCTMATITQMADFAGNNSTISGGAGGVDATWSYLSEDTLAHDQKLTDKARECMRYQLYAFANSAILNISTTPVTPSWEVALNEITIASYVVGGLLAFAWVCSLAVSSKGGK